MADYNKTNDDLETTNDTEPATKHDVGIGGGLGAVGGAIVGALAGGPVGAIIGAIAGGAASAGAIDVVDKHDHDFARTAGDTDAAGTTGYANTAATDTVTPGVGSAYTGAGDFQRTPSATTTDTDYVDTTPTANTGYANTATSANSGYANAASPTVGTNAERSVELHEEVLSAHTNRVQAGEVTLRKEVVTETKSIDVPVTREEVVIERHAASGTATAGSFDNQTDEVIRVPVMEEQVMVEKTPIVTEEISLGKREVTETQHVTDTVRREEAYIENPSNVDVLERDGKHS